MSGPDVAEVDALRDVLDLMTNFTDNDQRARYLLTCNWMRDRDTARTHAAVTEALEQVAAEIEARATREPGGFPFAERDRGLREAARQVRANIPPTT